MKENKYLIFEINNEDGLKEDHFFNSELYFNEKFKVSGLTLLHLHFEEKEYYLFFGRRGYQNELSFSFQFNKGTEFTDFLISNGAVYYRYDVVEVLKSNDYFRFKLKNNQIIQLQTYANGATDGLTLYDVTEKPKILLNLPYAKLRLDKMDNNLALKWSGTTYNGDLPDAFKGFLAERENFKKEMKVFSKKLRYFLLSLILIISIIVYYLF